MGVINPSKQELRKKLLEVRDGLEHRREREEAIAENLLSLPQYRRAASLLLYIGRASEVGTALILRRALEQGKEVCVPYCPPGDGAMFFCRIDSTEELKPGRYGILEPDPKKSLDHTDWQTVLCLVPGIAFDRLGYRLGYGKGYYDRFLAGKKIVAAGLCYRELVQQELPREPHDQRVQILITEDGSFAVSPQCPERKEFYGRSQ